MEQALTWGITHVDHLFCAMSDKARLRLGQEEVQHWEQYDYVIVNKNFDRAYADLGHIYRAERMKPSSGSIHGSLS